MEENHICAYCGEFAGNDKDHILPESFISNVNYSQAKYPIISMNGDGANLVPACVTCNSRKHESLHFPTIIDICTLFKNFSESQLMGYVDFLYSNKDAIMYYLDDRCLSYNGELEMFQTNMLYMNAVRDFKEFLELYDNGKFEKIRQTFH